MDREHTGGEVQRLGGVGTMQASGDELVATGVLALAAFEAVSAKVSLTPGVGIVRPGASVARINWAGRLMAEPAHELAMAPGDLLNGLVFCTLRSL